MGSVCGGGKNQVEPKFVRNFENFHISHEQKHAVLKSVFEEKANQEEGGFFQEMLHKLNIFHRASESIDQLYEDIANGKINLTDQNAKEVFQSKFYLLLFYIHFGEEDERYVNYRDNLIKFQNADQGWIDFYIKEYATSFRDHPKYISWKDQPEKLNFSRYTIPNNATILLFGDWGTGLKQASVLIQYASSFKPNIAIHLGDVYYSGTMREQKECFYYPLKANLNPDCKVFSLPGNHDYYSGGEGYQWVLEQIGQKASYICLENDFWCIIGMDTSHHFFTEFDIQILKKMPVLREDELEWIKDKANNAFSKNKKVILLSHHQLFSCVDSFKLKDEDVYLSYNKDLLEQLKDIIPKVTVWYWAHEHNFYIFKGFKGLTRGRLIGNGSCPQHDVDLDNLYVQSTKFTNKNDVPQMETGNWQAGTNGQTQNNGFTILDIKKNQCQATCYEVVSPQIGKWNKPKPSFQENY